MNPEQIEEIKNQLIAQINASFPDNKKQAAIEQIQGMNADELKEFLIQNNLIKADGTEATQECIFCKIVNGEIPTYKIDENDYAIATLDIRPLTRGHSLIIPKEHITKPDKIPEQAKELGVKVAEKIKQTLNPVDVEFKVQNMFGHEVINLIPSYSDGEINNERKPASEDELKSVQSELTKEIIVETPKKEEIIQKEPEPEILTEENTWLPRRIP